ncbi:MAG TPA: copper amine oxidase N-terminal domain-containing protein [Caldisericia bacterium]|nr:copper amine oxidase N-terminal domain-containing protein [Caldisericia bacterium]HPF49735.1 copper amine oxidase N-terminal domain-containing protein [Caldisericia bacterium]HPI84297.1 copper amine oxidase N-terminal domain-containing protein [Caldisericia bacterium]HPQ93724.1 copper amine oxidase N-terminal domain-containing protein [Caldisericia bacterium]HRV74852.1 copper amine oxidase N-terminal domain-containing protein [Caldisericia bacterium]
MRSKLATLAISMLLVMSLFPINGNVSYAQDGFKLEVTPGCGYNMLEWDAVPGAAHYWIYRGPGQGQEYSTPLTDFPIKETTFKDTINIQNGQLYCYYVRAVNAQAEEFAQSIEDCATPFCEEEEDDCKRILKYQIDNVMYWSDDTQKGPMEAPPEINQSRMFLLIRYVAEEVGALVDWVGSEKKIIITTTDGNIIEIWLNNPMAQVNGQPLPIDPNNPAVVGYVKEGRTLLPMRFVAENLGATGPNDIKWFAETRTVELYFDDPECRECMCITISSIDTTSNPPTAIGTDGAGKIWNLSFEGHSAALASKLEVGMCYEVCGYPQDSSSGNYSEIGTPLPGVQTVNIIKVTNVREVKCPCPAIDEGGDEGCSLCVKIVEISRTTGIVHAVDEWGGKWVLVRSPKLEAEFAEGSCITVFGHPTQGVNGKPGFEVERIGEGTCCEEDETECICIRISELGRYINDNFRIAVGVDENDVTYNLLVPREIASQMNAGDCWKLCGKVTTDQSEIGTPSLRKNMLVEEGYKDNCCGEEPELECVCVQITTVGNWINDNYRIMQGTDTNGEMVSMLVPREFATQMKEEECWKVCGEFADNQDDIGTPLPGRNMLVKEAYKEDCCEGTTQGDCICVLIEYFGEIEDGKKTVFAVDNDGYIWKLYVPIDLSNNMLGDQCWKVCGEVKEPNPFVTPPPYKEFIVEEGKLDRCCDGEVGPVECVWIMAKITDAKRVQDDADYPWRVYVEVCDTGDEMVEFKMSDSQIGDESGEKTIGYYRGCAKFCIANKIITKWVALPLVDDCCVGGDNPCKNAKAMRGKIIMVEENDSVSVTFEECGNDNFFNYFCYDDLTSDNGNISITDPKLTGRCVRICVNDDNHIVSFITIDNEECCPEDDRPVLQPYPVCDGRKFFGTVLMVTVDHDDGFVDIVIDECPDGSKVNLFGNSKTKDTSGKYTFADLIKLPARPCVTFCVEDEKPGSVPRIVSWTLHPDAESCCPTFMKARVVLGMYKSLEKSNTGDKYIVHIDECPSFDGYLTQYSMDANLKNIAGVAIEDFPTDVCAMFIVRGREIIRWVGRIGEKNCCTPETIVGFYEGMFELNGSHRIKISQCDKYEIQPYIDPEMMDLRDEYKLKDYPEHACIKLYMSNGRLMAWESMIGAQCCNMECKTAQGTYEGFSEYTGEMKELNIDFCAGKGADYKNLLAHINLQDTVGLYTFKTLPIGSCIEVCYNNQGTIVKWTYLGWKTSRECCP